MDKALVSVIIPAFDAAANIRQTLNSVLAQTYQEIAVKGKGPGMNSKKNGKRPFISNRIFENIERRRWSAALAEED